MIDHADRCPFCGQVSGFIYVSSHYQCAACGQVVESCCTGEQAQRLPRSSTKDDRSIPGTTAPNVPERR